MLSQAEYLIGRFGGLTAMSRALGHRNPTTVQRWKESGTIPPKRYPEILDAGANLDPPLEQRELVETRGGAPHRMSNEAAA